MKPSGVSRLPSRRPARFWMDARIIIINEADSVGIALREISAGEKVVLPGGGEVIARAAVPEGHKLAVTSVRRGDHVLKYGESIGLAAGDIAPGDWVHTHNLDPI